jgi:hypothetical protein
MLALLSRRFTRRSRSDTVDFCDSCAQVCTPECRSTAYQDRTRNQVLTQLPFPR